MSKFVLKLTVLIIFLLTAATSMACVGRTLYIGAFETSESKMMAEMISTLINERTGTTVQIRYFKSRDALYTALKSNVEEERADILVENTLDAITVLGTTSSASPDDDLVAVKAAYDKDMSIVWLNPFGYKNRQGQSGQSVSAPLVRRDVLTNFPLLPRVLNKLAGAITDKAYSDLLAKVEGGDKPKNAAKDFLKQNKLI